MNYKYKKEVYVFVMPSILCCKWVSNTGNVSLYVSIISFQLF